MGRESEGDGDGVGVVEVEMMRWLPGEALSFDFTVCGEVSLEQKLLSTFYVKLGVLLNMNALNSLQSSLVVEDKKDRLCRVSSTDSRSR